MPVLRHTDQERPPEAGPSYEEESLGGAFESMEEDIQSQILSPWDSSGNGVYSQKQVSSSNGMAAETSHPQLEPAEGREDLIRRIKRMQGSRPCAGENSVSWRSSISTQQRARELEYQHCHSLDGKISFGHL